MMRPERLLPAPSEPARPPRRGVRFAVGAGVSLLLHLGAALAFVGTWSPARPPEVGGQAVTVTLVQGPLARGGVPAEVSPSAETPGDDVSPASAAGREVRALRSAAAEAAPVPAGPPAESAGDPPSASPSSPAPPAPRTASPPDAVAPADSAAVAELRPSVPPPPAPARKPAVAEAPPDPAGTLPPPPPKPRRMVEATGSATGGQSAAQASAAPAPAATPARRTPRARQLAGLTVSHDGGGPGAGGADGEDSARDDVAAAAGQGAAGAAPRAGNPAPEYPARARRRGWEGRVLLEVTVDAEGRVAGLRTLESSGYDLLDRAAAEAVRRWRFTPARRLGRQVADTVEVPVRFALRDR